MYAEIPPVVAGGEGRRCLPISPLPSTRGAWGGAAGEGMVAGGEGRRCLPIPPLLLDARAEEEAGPTQPLLNAGAE